MSGSDDDDVYVVDSSSADERSESSRSYSADAFGQPFEHALARAAQLNLDGAAAPKLPRDSPTLVVNTGTNTDSDYVPLSLAVQLRRHLVDLAHAVSARSPSSPLAPTPTTAPETRHPTRKRDRDATPWADSLAQVRTTCARLAEAAPREHMGVVPLPSRDVGDVEGPVKIEEPVWLPQLQEVLSTVASDLLRHAESPAEPRQPLPVPRYLLCAAEEAAAPVRGGAAPSVGQSAPPATLPRVEPHSEALTAAERETLAEAALILSKEKAARLLDVYSELTHLRRTHEDATVRAAQSTSGELTRQELLLRMMLEHLAGSLRRAEAAFRHSCGAAADGDAASPPATSRELQSEMDAISRVRRELAALLKEGSSLSALSAAVVATEHGATGATVPPGGDEAADPTACDGHEHGHGYGHDAFAKAQLTELASLHQTVRQLQGQLQESQASAADWRARYETAAARLLDKEDEETRSRIRPEVFKAYRDRCRECLGRLASVLGRELTELVGWRATLVPAAGAATSPTGKAEEFVVDLASGEVLSGTLPSAFQRSTALPNPAARTPAPAASELPTREPPSRTLVPSLPSSPPLSPLKPPVSAADSRCAGATSKEAAATSAFASAMGQQCRGTTGAAPEQLRAAATAWPPRGNSADMAANSATRTAVGTGADESTDDAKLTVPFSNDATVTDPTQVSTSHAQTEDFSSFEGAQVMHASSPFTREQPPGTESPRAQTPTELDSSDCNSASRQTPTPPPPPPRSAVAGGAAVATSPTAHLFSENGLWDDES